MNKSIYKLACVLILGTPLIAESRVIPLGAAVIENSAPAPAQLKNNSSTEKNSGQLAASMIEASQAAQEYVDMLDKKRYAESWSRGAKLFQKTISQHEWSKALELARGRLGAVKSRKLKDEKPAWDPVGLPKGAYMVVEYDTEFERAAHSGELLTLMQEKDGTWKVLTYQVN